MALKTWNELPYAIKKSPRRMYEYIKAWNELPYAIKKSPRRMYEYIKGEIDTLEASSTDNEETLEESSEQT